MDIIVELFKAIGRLFMNPLFYIAIAAFIFLGYVRVKRERKYFKTRILTGWTELKIGTHALWISIVLSIISMLIGLVLPVSFLIILTCVSILMLITMFYHFITPIWLFFITALVLFLFDVNDWSFNIFGFEISGLRFDEQLLVSVTVLAGLLLYVEGRFIKKHGAYFASPIMEKTKRGLQVGAFQSKGLWMLPLFVLVPGDVVKEISVYWPVFGFGEQTFSIVIFPFIVGFQFKTRKSLPVNFYENFSKPIQILGQIIIILGLIGYYYPIMSIITLAVGAIIRFIITLVAAKEEKQEQYAIAPQKKGVMILSVLPNSPAEKMGLTVGEIIVRVNAQEVNSEKELYEALQINAAHCKLEVLDHQGEIRLTQHVVHRNDNHKIGVVLIH